MDATEAKVRCLELAAATLRPSGVHDVRSVVEIATVMYDYVNAPPKPPETGTEATPDKPKPGGRKAKAPDPFS